MLSIKKIFYFYMEGFRNMTVGRTLWKIIFLKLTVILIFLKYFIHDKQFKTEYKTEDEKIGFVYENLISKEKR